MVLNKMVQITVCKNKNFSFSWKIQIDSLKLTKNDLMKILKVTSATKQ